MGALPMCLLVAWASCPCVFSQHGRPAHVSSRSMGIVPMCLQGQDTRATDFRRLRKRNTGPQSSTFCHVEYNSSHFEHSEKPYLLFSVPGSCIPTGIVESQRTRTGKLRAGRVSVSCQACIQNRKIQGRPFCCHCEARNAVAIPCLQRQVVLSTPDPEVFRTHTQRKKNLFPCANS